MTSLLLRSMALRAGPLALLLTLVLSPAPARGENGLICGKPKKTGHVTMNVVVKRGADTRVVAVTLLVDSSWTAEYKANLFWTAFAATKSDTVLPAQTIAKLTMTGQNGWTVTGVGIANDESEEPDQELSAAPFADQGALCSLSGTASGYAADGSPGSFRVTVSGRTVVLPTFPGMSASILEQQLFGQLNGMGVQTRFATAADFANGLEVLPHDASVLWIKPTDDTGFEQELSDTGLVMQLGMLLDTRPVGTAGVAEPVARSGITLRARPSVWSHGLVQFQYALERSDRSGEVACFDAGGRRVRSLVAGDGSTAGATGVVSWDGRDERGGAVPCGTYFVRLTSGRSVATTRVVKVR